MPHNLGSLLRQKGFIDDGGVEAALRYQRQTGYRFGEALLALNLCTPEELQYAVFKQLDRGGASAAHSALPAFFAEVFRFRYQVALLLLTSLLAVLLSFPVIFAHYMAFVVDHILPANDFQGLGTLTLFAGAALLLNSALEYLSTYMAGWINTRVHLSIGGRLFEHVSHISLPLFLKLDRNELSTRFSENMDQTSRGLQQILQQGARSFFLLLVSLIMLGSFSMLLLLLTLPIIIAMLWLPVRVSKRANPHLQEEADQIARLSSRLREMLQSFAVVRLGKTGNFLRLFTRELDRHYGNQARKWLAWVLSFNCKVSLNYLVLTLLIWVGGNQVLDERLLLGELLAFYFLLNALMPKLDELYSCYVVLNTVKANWIPIFSLTRLPTDERDIDDFSSHRLAEVREIRFEAVDFSYRPGERTVFRELDLHCSAGQMYSVIGLSGSGKSTFIKLLAGLYHPTSGRIVFDQQDAAYLSNGVRWRAIAYMEQHAFIYQGHSLRENIELGVAGFGRQLDDAEIEEALRLAGLDDQVASWPQGLDTVLGRGDIALSGGQEQRLALARCLVKKAPVRIFDEPTAALDETSSAHVQASIQASGASAISFVVTHDWNWVERIPNMLLFQNGSLQVIHDDPAAIAAVVEQLRRAGDAS